MKKIEKWHVVADGDFPEPEDEVIVTVSKYNDCLKQNMTIVCPAVYIPKYSKKSEDFWYDFEEYNEDYYEDEDTFYVKEGWFEVNGRFGDFIYWYIDGDVLAWMELPDPWKETGAGGVCINEIIEEQS